MSSWLLNKFFMSVPKEMYGEQNGEYVFWCQGVKGYSLSYHLGSQNQACSPLYAFIGILSYIVSA